MIFIDRRDLEFAFQLEELRTIELLCLFDERLRDRVEDLFGMNATAITNAEGKIAELEQAVQQFNNLQDQITQIARHVDEVQVKLEEARRLAARTNQRLS